MDLERVAYSEQRTTEVNAEGRSMVRSTLGTRMTEVKSSWKPWKNRGKLDVFILEFCDEKCVA